MSIMTDIAAVIRGKLNAMTTAINGKAALSHPHTTAQITGLPTVRYGTHDATGMRIAGTIPFTKTSTGVYRALLSDFGFTVTLSGGYYYINNGSIVFNVMFNITFNYYCDTTYIYLRTFSGAFTAAADSPFYWVAAKV
jgi:hypothetical protein